MISTANAQKNTKELFEDILNHYLPGLKRLCMGYEASPDLRQELMQEILLNLWRSLPTYRHEASLKTWMYRVALNVASRHSITSSRNPINHPTLEEDQFQNLSGAEEDIEECVVKILAIERMRELIRSLPSLDRQIILLYLEEVPQSEIADITGLSRDNISTRVNRIKQLFMKKMRRSS